MINYSRYPISQKEYMQKTGRLLAHRIGQQLQHFGYNTWICKEQNNGVDLKVYNLNGCLIFVAELLNWSPYTEMSNKRKRWIKENLKKYSCYKLLIYTAMKNQDMLNDLYKDSICILKLGYQILPKFFYKHYEAKNQVEGRSIDSKETTLHIKSQLLSFLESLTLQPLTPYSDIADIPEIFSINKIKQF